MFKYRRATIDLVIHENSIRTMVYSTTIKFSLLLFVVIFCYVQSIPTESTTTTSAPVVAAVLVDVKDEQNLNILAKLNRSIPEESEPKKSSDDMSEYYNWLSFIKTSTVPSNSSEILLKNNN